jgi:hypothetical protein
MVAPIVLFVYNRPEHTRKTIEALSNNILASESDLFIYSDAAKDEAAIEKVNAVRSYIKAVSGFKAVTIIEREKNWGLADSIIDGVTGIVNKYGKVIVLEDDIVTSRYFLKFMNGALSYYADESSVWHICGWNCSIDPTGLGDAFFWFTLDCWGWATWKDRWISFEKDADKLIEKFSKKDIFKFNISNSENIWGQVLANKAGKINTWAVFWYATIFQNKGLCLNPTISFVRNIGFDGSGVNCGKSSFFYNEKLCEQDISFSDIEIKENTLALRRIKKYYKKLKRPFIIRIANKIIHCFNVLR